MSKQTYAANLYLNPLPQTDLTIDGLTGGKNATPGNVGICLCGGGSRALSAGMGQLRALNHLQANGASLLSQTKALSTVSGGSWLGITFEFQQSVPDTTFLNTYIDDPASLTVDDIAKLPDGNIGQQIGHNFSVIDIALQALYYYVCSRTPDNMLWQTVIAKHILKPYGLYEPGRQQAPTQAFSYSAETVHEIQNLSKQNPDLADIEFLTLSSNATRPYFICNTALFVTGAQPVNGDYKYLVPIQSTPFFTGVVGNPTGFDANGVTPGGGGVTSFAFNSQLENVAGSSATVSQSCPWSILDCVGASSAAYAEKVVNLFSHWRNNRAELLAALHSNGHSALRFVQEDLEHEESVRANDWLQRMLDVKIEGTVEHELERLLRDIEIDGLDILSIFDTLTLESLVPKYDYWPVGNAKANPDLKPTHFADGGNLENTGVASMLSYSDIDNVIAFVNSTTLLAPKTTEDGKVPEVKVDQHSGILTTKIVVDGQIPPLFGYQPYKDSSYVPYDGGENANKDTAFGVHSQVFPSENFKDFLTQLWTAASGSKAPAIYQQSTAVVANAWFGVPAREGITITWVYTSTVSDWECMLQGEVKDMFDKVKDFPNYSTLNTELSEIEVNFLASLTAWCVGNPNNRDVFSDLYRDRS